MVPSLDAAADTTFAVFTITKGSIQVNATRAGWGDQQQHNVLDTPGRFSRRLQLAPGLEPPTSWSLSPVATRPKLQQRTQLSISPGSCPDSPEDRKIYGKSSLDRSGFPGT